MGRRMLDSGHFNLLDTSPALYSMENEPAETALEGPQISIPHVQATIPVPTKTAFHSEQQHSSTSPIIQRYYWLFFVIKGC